MNFLKKKLGIKHRNNADSSDFEEEDCRRVPVNAMSAREALQQQQQQQQHAPVQKTRSGNNSNVTFQTTAAPSPDGYNMRTNTGYAGDLSRSAPPKPSILTSGKPLFSTNQFSTWPDDEFNEQPPTYIDPSHNIAEDEYDSPEEPDHDEPSNIGQTEFFGHQEDNSCSGDDPSNVMMTVVPQSSTINSNNSSLPAQLDNSRDHHHHPAVANSGVYPPPNGAMKILRASSSIASSGATKQNSANANRSALSSGASSSSVSRHESVNNNSSSNRRAISGCFAASAVATATSTTTIITTTAANATPGLLEQPSPHSSSPGSSGNSSSSSSTGRHELLQQQPPLIQHNNNKPQLPQLPQRPQPKVLGSRISEGLDTNKVVAGIQTMVKMNQQSGNNNNKVPPTPPKPANFAVSLNERPMRFVAPPPTVTPPDSDECEPELPSRIKSMMIPADCASSSSPSPSSETVSSGTSAVQPKKRQAPLPPSVKLSNSTLRQQQQQQPATEVPLPPPVPNFVANQTPSVTSSSEGGDDIPTALINTSTNRNLLESVKKLSLQHTASTPVTITANSNNNNNSTAPTANFANRPSNGSSSSSGVSSMLSSASSSASTSSNKLALTAQPSHHRVLVKVPSNSREIANAQVNQSNIVASTSFTSSRKQPSGSSSALQVTVISTGSGYGQTNDGNGSGASSTAAYTSDDDVYTGAESLQYNLFTFDWYHGKMTRQESERKLRENGQEGAFLVRECNNTASEPYALFTLCLYARGACHYIQVCRRPDANDRLAVGSQKESEKTFGSLQELVTFHMNEAPLVVQPRSTGGAESQFLCSLKHAIMR